MKTLRNVFSHSSGGQTLKSSYQSGCAPSGDSGKSCLSLPTCVAVATPCLVAKSCPSLSAPKVSMPSPPLFLCVFLRETLTIEFRAHLRFPSKDV